MGAFIGTPIYRKRARIRTGSYVGDSVDNRDINIGIDLAAKNSVWIVIKTHDGADIAVHRPELGQGDLTERFDLSAAIADCIQALTATGFQIGASTRVNDTGDTYYYIAIWEEP